MISAVVALAGGGCLTAPAGHGAQVGDAIAGDVSVECMALATMLTNDAARCDMSIGEEYGTIRRRFPDAMTHDPRRARISFSMDERTIAFDLRRHGIAFRYRVLGDSIGRVPYAFDESVDVHAWFATDRARLVGASQTFVTGDSTAFRRWGRAVTAGLLAVGARHAGCVATLPGYGARARATRWRRGGQIFLLTEQVTFWSTADTIAYSVVLDRSDEVPSRDVDPEPTPCPDDVVAPLFVADLAVEAVAGYDSPARRARRTTLTDAVCQSARILRFAAVECATLRRRAASDTVARPVLPVP
jgi:hypothetical protein